MFQIEMRHNAYLNIAIFDLRSANLFGNDLNSSESKNHLSFFIFFRNRLHKFVIIRF